LYPRDYENAFYNKLLYEFRGPEFLVGRNERERGRFSKSLRQLDVTVRRNIGARRPIYLLVDTKKKGRKIDVKDVEAFMGMMEDVDVSLGLIVAPRGYTKGAINRATAKNLHLEIMSYEEALEMNFRELARNVFPMDWAFHPQMAKAYRATEEKNVELFIEAMETVPYEEWAEVARSSFGIGHLREGIVDILMFIAKNHYSSDWRFNAIQLLDEFGELDWQFIYALLSIEKNLEVRELLENLYGHR